jgi:hypothetical protein
MAARGTLILSFALLAACATPASTSSTLAPQTLELPAPSPSLVPAAGAGSARPLARFDDWTTVAPPGGGFTARMPAAPEEDTLAHDPISTHVYEVEAADGAIVYTVARTDYPEDDDAPDPEHMLDSARDAMVFTSGATLSFERHITIGAVPGRELRLDDPRHTVRARLFADKRHVFEVSVSVRASEPWPESEAAFFFDAFRLSER